MLLVSIIIGIVVGLLALFGLTLLLRLSSTTRRMENDLRRLRSELELKERALAQQRQTLVRARLRALLQPRRSTPVN